MAAQKLKFYTKGVESFLQKNISPYIKNEKFNFSKKKFGKEINLYIRAKKNSPFMEL